MVWVRKIEPKYGLNKSRDFPLEREKEDIERMGDFEGFTSILLAQQPNFSLDYQLHDRE